MLDRGAALLGKCFIRGYPYPRAARFVSFGPWLIPGTTGKDLAMTPSTLARYMLSISGAAAILVGCAANAGGTGGSPIVAFSKPATNQQTFSYTGAQQTFKVPSGVKSITVVADGAAGAFPKIGKKNKPGRGLGGRTQATVTVTSGETLYVFVGGLGSSTGGFNGGGAPPYSGGAGGGGGSDVRRGGNGLANRILVAGAGGGSGGSNGGNGGGVTGQAGKQVPPSSNRGGGGGGGTQHQGGAGGTAGAYAQPGSAGTLSVGGAGGLNGGYKSKSGGNGGGAAAAVPRTLSRVLAAFR